MNRAKAPLDGSTAAPHLRVVVLDYNGGEMTIGCLRALLEAGFGGLDFEVVLVDNGSADSVAEQVEKEMPEVRVLRSSVNLGFAGGNNLALDDLDGVDLVALINNDVTVGPGWLPPLVDALAGDDSLGAASPKMLFAGHYRRLDLSVPAEPPWPADARERGVRVVDVDPGPDITGTVQFGAGFYEPERERDGVVRWTSTSAVAFVPVTRSDTPSCCTLTIDSDRDKDVEAVSGSARSQLPVRQGRHRYDVTLDGEPIDLVNNVGTELVGDAYGADRGWLDPDDGRHDVPCEVFGWSGGAVLLRADYLRDTGIFDERLFLYYEDLELAWRGRRRGWRYRFVPQSVVRHLHSATAGRQAARTRYFNERNHLLVLARHASWSTFLHAVARFVLVTASYARRDVVAPLLRAERPRPEITWTRMQAFAGFLARVPGQVASRRLTSRSAP